MSGRVRPCSRGSRLNVNGTSALASRLASMLTLPALGFRSDQLREAAISSASTRSSFAAATRSGEETWEGTWGVEIMSERWQVEGRMG